jgi:hypothetical protein
MSDETLLRTRGIRERMRCSGQVAHQIEQAFVTVEQLVAAIESDRELTDYDGIGPKTAPVIDAWWKDRFEREDAMSGNTFERTGTRTATIHIHTSWDDAIGPRPDGDMTDTAEGRR